ncbi:hypothetical protein N7488_011488 [Penicillium malachiteum]|nr:hypothetical protein N7488_011488 [Penicillium malachiteum]
MNSVTSSGGRRTTRACFECKTKKRRCTHPTNEPGTSSPELADARLADIGSLQHDEVSNIQHFNFSLILFTHKLTDPTFPITPPMPPKKKSRKTPKSSKNVYDGLPTVSDISKRIASASMESAPEMPEHPTDNLDGSARLGIHSVFSRELEGRINQMQAEQNAARLAFEEAMIAIQASIHSATDVVKLVDDWKEAWEKGQ